MRFMFKKKSKKKPNSKGFTLVEVLCAVVLLAIIATPIFQVIFTSLKLNLKSRKMLNASDLCSATTEFVSSKVLETYSYDVTVKVPDPKKPGEQMDKKDTYTSVGYRDYYCGGGKENEFKNTAITGLKLYNSDPALAKVYVYEKPSGGGYIQAGPTGTYSSLSDWKTVEASEVSKIGPAKSYEYRTLEIDSIEVDGFLYDMTIKTYIPSKTCQSSYYCGVVFIDVYESGKTNSLCSSKTSIANKY